MQPDHSTFGKDTFGVLAERFARFFGTPKFILVQTGIIICWLILNGLVIANGWDPYPFILLNLVFSTQAAYAAPLILLAQTRQADRDKHSHEHQVALEESASKHRDAIAEQQRELLQVNTKITEQIADLTQAIHQHVTGEAKAGLPQPDTQMRLLSDTPLS